PAGCPPESDAWRRNPTLRYPPSPAGGRAVFDDCRSNPFFVSHHRQMVDEPCSMTFAAIPSSVATIARWWTSRVR
ncbi:MAG: hypothetical protein ACK5S3_03340, partial [Pirellulaceae bacterium]